MRKLSCVLLVTALAALPQSNAADDFKVEDGFKLIFNGKDLTGWKAKKDNASLDDKTEAYDGRFKVKDGILIIDTKVKGDVIINTAKDYDKDVHIKFDYMPGKGCNNDLFFRGNKFDIKKPDVKNLKEDEWNEFEIIVKGDTIEFKSGGEVMRSAKTKPGATPLGIRAEFGGIQFRRMRIKAE